MQLKIWIDIKSHILNQEHFPLILGSEKETLQEQL